MRDDIKPLPSAERLVGLLTYDPDTGSLKWLPRGTIPPSRGDRMFNSKHAGKNAGTVGKSGYLTVCIRERGEKFKTYYAHRLIWKMVLDVDPDQIDHVDGDRLNNAWDNLRAASNGKNIQNSKRRKDNKSGVKGVCWDVRRKKWRVVISADGVHYRLGRFSTLAAAAAAIMAERDRLHGEFARHQ